MDQIAANLRRVQDRIASAARRCGRTPEEITLVAVTKTFPAETVRLALTAGQVDFGENRVQEAAAKIESFRDRSALRWHLIGHLQTNKARHAAEIFDCIHSLDSIRLAQKLDQACAAMGKCTPVLLEVDFGEEDTKFGAARDELRGLVEAVSDMKSLRLDGLMAIPPFWEDPERVRPYFAELRRIRDALETAQPGCLGAKHLSMGMSHDFECAIQEGATIVRVGTAIFGERHLA